MPDHVELRSPFEQRHVLESKYCMEEVDKSFSNFVYLILRVKNLSLRSVKQLKGKEIEHEMQAPTGW